MAVHEMSTANNKKVRALASCKTLASKIGSPALGQHPARRQPARRLRPSNDVAAPPHKLLDNLAPLEPLKGPPGSPR